MFFLYWGRYIIFRGGKYTSLREIKIISMRRGKKNLLFMSRSLKLIPPSPELKTLEWWISRLMLDLLFFLI